MSTSKLNKGSVKGPFLFIVNPNSGTGVVNSFGEALASVSNPPDHEVVISESGKHSVELARSAASNGFAAVVAVGGDGSVNEIGRQLIGTDLPLGIVPTGSGNGVARHFRISTRLPNAIRQAFRGNVRTIDTIQINDQTAVGFCGLGFDGYIAREFNKLNERGFASYAKLTLDCFNTYEAHSFTVIVDSAATTFIGYSLIVANAKQLGNNAFINPTGKEDDGQLELIVIEDFPKAQFPSIVSRLFLQNIHKSKYVNTLPVKKVTIQNLERQSLQIDGEYAGEPSEVHIEVNPASLNILVPK